MDIYGADFSGAGDPSKGIYFAHAELQGEKLAVTRVTHCDDRLDLFHAIVASRAPWGLDFPFSYSSLAINKCPKDRARFVAVSLIWSMDNRRAGKLFTVMDDLCSSPDENVRRLADEKLRAMATWG